MPTFVNTNRHRIYVLDPERDLVRVLPGREIEATGAFADNLAATAGVEIAGSKEAKAAAESIDNAALDSHGAVEDVPHAGGVDFSSMNKKELLAYAESEGIDVDKKAKVGDLRDQLANSGGTVTTADTPSK